MTGPRILPTTPARPVPAAALVVDLTRPIPLDPMYRQLDAHPDQRGIARMRLEPITVFDFYAREHALPDLQALGRQADAAGDSPAWPGGVRERAAVGVPASACELHDAFARIAGSGRGAAEVEGAA